MVEDKNIVLGKVPSPTEATADGGGITILGPGGSDKYITYNSSNSTWQISENLDLSANKVYRIANNDVLSSTALGSSVVDSSLTTLGTLTSLEPGGNVGIGKNASETYKLDVNGEH